MGVWIKKFGQKKSAQSMGVLHEKNWPKKAPPSFLHEGRWGGGFLNISVNQIADFEKWQKIKNKWGEKLQCKLMLAKLIGDF
jgi:hypothetical protein